MVKRAVFIGRWSPFHKGHLAIMQKKIDQNIPLLILVRNTHYDLYPPLMRKRMIEAAMKELKVDAKVLIIDDIESINWGRGVGYEANEIAVPDSIKGISATDIRSRIERHDDSWKEFIPKGADKVLSDYLSDKGIVVWFTGLPKAGKSTIAKQVSYGLEQKGIRSEILNGGVLRTTISKDLGFSKKDRDVNLERGMHIAGMLARNGAIVLSVFIAPYESQREMLRKELEKHATYVEVYVKATVKSAKKRDKQGMYEKAEEGKIEHFTGVSDPFEEPKNPDIVLDTDKYPMEQCSEQLLEFLDSVISR